MSKKTPLAREIEREHRASSLYIPPCPWCSFPMIEKLNFPQLLRGSNGGRWRFVQCCGRSRMEDSHATAEEACEAWRQNRLAPSEHGNDEDESFRLRNIERFTRMDLEPIAALEVKEVAA